MIKTIDSTTAKKKLAELRKINPKSYVTNYCLNPLSSEVLCLENSNAIVLLISDRNIHRMIFAYLNLSSFEEILCELPNELQISLEIVTKNDIDDNLKRVLEKYLSYDTTYIRSTCKLKNIHNFKIGSSDKICYATLSDISDIERLLNETFSHHSSHLPDIVELEKLILNKQVIVLKNGGILGVDIFKRVGKNINCDQLVNRDKNFESTLMLLNFLYDTLHQLDVDECFLWVDIENNRKVQKMHELYGYKPDGLKNVIYVNRLLKSTLNKLHEENKNYGA